MDVETALELADELVFATTGKHLNDLQKCVFQESWQCNTFTQIAEACNCNESHAKEVGSKLWTLLSSALGEPVGKKNLKPPLERRWKAQQSGKISNQDSVTHQVPQSTLDPNFVGRENAIANSSQNEEATDNTLEAQVQEKIQRKLENQANISQERLFGIEKYVTELREYLQDKEGSWFISVVGTGGVGKTSIVEKLVREHTVDSGFVDLAWVTAKRNYFRVEDRSIQNTRSPLNIEGLVSDIAEQLQIDLPPTLSEHFSYLQSKLKAAPYLIVIDNLETLEDYQELLEKFHFHSPKNNIKPSKIIFTSRKKIQKLSFEVREVELKGISVTPTLELIRYKGGHVQRIYDASDEELLPIFKATNGIPLLILLIVSLIATDDSPLEEIIQSLPKQGELYKYLYEEALISISDNASKLLESMTDFSASSPVTRHDLSEQSELSDDEFKEAVGECIERSLLTSLSSLSDEPRYTIHNLLYAFVREMKSGD
jgi:GTPase SAR1 family protein